VHGRLAHRWGSGPHRPDRCGAHTRAGPSPVPVFAPDRNPRRRARLPPDAWHWVVLLYGFAESERCDGRRGTRFEPAVRPGRRGRVRPPAPLRVRKLPALLLAPARGEPETASARGARSRAAPLAQRGG